MILPIKKKWIIKIKPLVQCIQYHTKTGYAIALKTLQ